MNSAQPLLHPPLTDDEIAKLDEGLSRIDPDDSMAVEELDGYFAALACCPQPIPRDEWLPLVLGESRRAQAALAGQGEDARLLELIERHRVAVSAMLYDGQGFAPVLTHDEEGKAWGNAWAIGFVRGMALRPDAWAALEEDDEFADVLDPVMRLVADADIDDGEDGEDEREPDSQAVDLEASYEPIAEDEREAVIHEMMDGVQDVYEFFRLAREKALAPPTIRRDQPKVGRNDPCACGSGRKFKNCCGASPAA